MKQVILMSQKEKKTPQKPVYCVIPFIRSSRTGTPQPWRQKSSQWLPLQGKLRVLPGRRPKGALGPCSSSTSCSGCWIRGLHVRTQRAEYLGPDHFPSAGSQHKHQTAEAREGEGRAKADMGLSAQDVGAGQSPPSSGPATSTSKPTQPASPCPTAPVALRLLAMTL